MKKRALILLVAFVVLLAADRSLARQQGELIERVLVRVNGEILTQKQLTQRQIEALQGNPAVTDLRSLQDDAKLKALIAGVTPRVLVEAVDDLLMVQRGRELKLKFTDELFKQGLDNLKKRNDFKDDAQFTTALAQEGMALDTLRLSFERAYIIQAVQQREIGQRMNLTEEERRQYYNSHRESFLNPATLTLREIFVPFPVAGAPKGAQQTVSPDDEAATKTKIEAVRARAVQGADFTALVTEVSEAPTKANGGLVGPVNVDDINPVLKEAITRLKAGEISAPVRGPLGFQIFKLESRSEAEARPYDQVRDQIQQRIYEDRLDGETQKLLERLRSQAVIEWKDDTYRQMHAKALGENVSK